MAVNTITVDPPGQSSPLVLYSEKPELGPKCAVSRTPNVYPKRAQVWFGGVLGGSYT
jgi:hypothetical protein